MNVSAFTRKKNENELGFFLQFKVNLVS